MRWEARPSLQGSEFSCRDAGIREPPTLGNGTRRENRKSKEASEGGWMHKRKKSSFLLKLFWNPLDSSWTFSFSSHLTDPSILLSFRISCFFLKKCAFLPPEISVKVCWIHVFVHTEKRDICFPTGASVSLRLRNRLPEGFIASHH